MWLSSGKIRINSVRLSRTLMDILNQHALYERLSVEPVTRLFVSFEAVELLEMEGVQWLKGLFSLPGVLPALIGAPPPEKLRSALPLEGVLYAGWHGSVFHEPGEAPDRLENHLHLSQRDAAALRCALTGWVLANRSPSDAFAVYIGCAAYDLLAMQLIEQLNGWGLFGRRECLPIGADEFKQPAFHLLFS